MKAVKSNERERGNTSLTEKKKLVDKGLLTEDLEVEVEEKQSICKLSEQLLQMIMLSRLKVFPVN